VTRQMHSDKVRGTLKQRPPGVLVFAIITAILGALLWAAATSHNSEALTPGRTWVVD